MRWTVVWTDDAVNQLAELWSAAPNRAAVTAASQEADRLLRDHPLEAGEERSPPEFLLLEDPLSILYRVSPDDCLVTVIAVWAWGYR